MFAYFPDFIANNPGLFLAAAIVLIGLFGLGLKDLLRFSPTRLWAVSTIAVQQSFRRRVLWITPLLILGVITVCQLQKSFDAQDVIRQTTMVCLFASGLLVTLLTIILAATNLPREIENRVIYTIATKPVTRLEIVLGKVVGFARVSFWLLFIMGLFTYGYLHLQNYTLRNYVSAQLATPGAVDDSIRPTLEYYRDHGLLHARDLGLPDSLSLYSHLPTSPTDRWIPGLMEGEMIVRFTIDPLRIPRADPAADPASTRGGVFLHLPILYRSVSRPLTNPRPATTLPVPRISFSLSNANKTAFITNRELGAPQGIEIPNAGGILNLFIPPKALAQLLPPNPDASPADLFLQVTCDSNAYEYSMSRDGLAFSVPETRHRFLPVSDIAFAGRDGAYGQQLRGGSDAPNRVALYRFTNQKPHPTPTQFRLFEVRLGVERLEEDASSYITLDFLNRDTGQLAPTIQTAVETNRSVYLNVPASAVDSGNFDVIIRTPSNAWLGLRDGPLASLKFVKHDQSFALNLVKSLFIIWLMSLLVTIIAIFASTFLSWPIAVVLTVVILSGHWAAQQVVDVQSSTGIGRQIVNDLMPRDIDPASAKAVSSSVDALVATLNSVAAILPDISQFSAIQEIQQGIAISPAVVLFPALQVTFGFGLPLLVLAYAFLKYKEVAP